MNRELDVSVDPLVDCLECIQDATDNKTIIETIDEVIDIVYHLAKEKQGGRWSDLTAKMK